jgi:uncharacterized protein YdhG (YjbR/CyaY superfamily)
MQNTQAKTIDEYILPFPEDVRKLLEKLRETIRKAAPQAEETINYAMPTFKLNGNLVHFAAYKNHIGFYPAPSGIAAYKKELSAYELSKGAIQFPLNKPLPWGVITKIVKFRVKEQLAKVKTKEKPTLKKK